MVSALDPFCTVVAFDPGGTTGWAILAVRPNSLKSFDTPLHQSLTWYETGQIDCAGSDNGEGTNYGHGNEYIDAENLGVVQMLNVFDKVDRPAVVHEAFVLDPGKANMGQDLLSPVRIIAKFTYAHWEQDLSGLPIFLQNRSPVKTTCTDERLREWSINPTGGHAQRHARDAVRHAYYFLREARGSSPKAAYNRFLAWPHLFPDPQIRPAKPTSHRKIGEIV